MADFDERFQIVKRAIHGLNQEVVQAIHSEEFEKANTLLNERYNLLTELVSIVSTKADKQLILPYLNEFQQSDQALTVLVQQERKRIADTMHNLNNLRQYTDV